MDARYDTINLISLLSIAKKIHITLPFVRNCLSGHGLLSLSILLAFVTRKCLVSLKNEKYSFIK